VQFAAHGADALSRLEQQPFDLVLSDTKMPIIDGVKLYRAIERRFPALRHRLIFPTGDALDPDKLSLSKPPRAVSDQTLRPGHRQERGPAAAGRRRRITRLRTRAAGRGVR
jgi:CheY-like chemotaxis protein